MTNRIEVTPENAQELRDLAISEKEEHSNKPTFQGINVNPHKGGGRITFDASGMHQEVFNGTTTIQADDPATLAEAGILATAHDPGSRVLTGAITENTLVYVDGFETSVAAATTMGYLRKIGPGQYQETSSSPK